MPSIFNSKTTKLDTKLAAVAINFKWLSHNYHFYLQKNFYNICHKNNDFII